MTENEDKKISKTVFRLQLIQDAILKSEDGEKITPLLKEIAGKFHLHPFKGRVKLTLSTLFRYVSRYKKSGIEGLTTKTRSDKGVMRKISEEILKLVIKYRDDNNDRTTMKLLEILKREHGIDHVKRSTLDHYLDMRGFSRKRLGVIGAKVHMRFESTNPNDLWIGDYHDRNDMLTLQNGKMVHLNVFIDCNSRFITHGQYYLSEDILTLEDTFKLAVLKWGIPQRAFVDNAKVYHSTRFAYCCQSLGVKLIFSKAYVKESRGKIEKYFSYVKLNFESEVLHRGGCDSLEELNKLYWAWQDMNYLTKKHSEINDTPSHRYHENLKPNHINISKIDELFMLKSTRKVTLKTCRVSVLGQKFLTESFLSGRKVQVHYNPNNLSFVLIYYKEKFIHRAKPARLNEKPEQPETTRDDDKTANLNYDYLDALYGQYKQHLGRHLIKVDLSDQQKNNQIDKVYGYDNFIKDMAEILSCKISKDQKQTCLDFYNSYQPFSQQTCREALTYALGMLQDKGYAIEYYLNYLKLFILNSREK